jgi:hypothetical protein
MIKQKYSLNVVPQNQVTCEKAPCDSVEDRGVELLAYAMRKKLYRKLLLYL